MRDLNRLKGWLLRRRTETRIDRGRTERWERKKKTARKKAEQPALFQF